MDCNDSLSHACARESCSSYNKQMLRRNCGALIILINYLMKKTQYWVLMPSTNPHSNAYVRLCQQKLTSVGKVKHNIYTPLENTSIIMILTGK